MNQIVLQIAYRPVGHKALVDFSVFEATASVFEETQGPIGIPSVVHDWPIEEDHAPIDVVANERALIVAHASCDLRRQRRSNAVIRVTPPYPRRAKWHIVKGPIVLGGVLLPLVLV